MFSGNARKLTQMDEPKLKNLHEIIYITDFRVMAYKPKTSCEALGQYLISRGLMITKTTIEYFTAEILYH